MKFIASLTATTTGRLGPPSRDRAEARRRQRHQHPHVSQPHRRQRAAVRHPPGRKLVASWSSTRRASSSRCTTRASPAKTTSHATRRNRGPTSSPRKAAGRTASIGKRGAASTCSKRSPTRRSTIHAIRAARTSPATAWAGTARGTWASRIPISSPPSARATAGSASGRTAAACRRSRTADAPSRR